MKKLNFDNIKNVLNRNEMKQIMAGSGPSGGYCYGSPGAWTYTHGSSWQGCVNDIATYCPSGSGHCY